MTPSFNRTKAYGFYDRAAGNRGQARGIIFVLFVVAKVKMKNLFVLLQAMLTNTWIICSRFKAKIKHLFIHGIPLHVRFI